MLVIGAAALLGQRVWGRRSVSVARVERGTAVDAVYGTGTIEATNRVVVKARISGPIARILVQEGERVAAGDLLAWIDAPALRHDVRRGESEVTAARDRATPQLSALRASQRVLTAQIAQARLELKRTEGSAKLGSSAPQDVERIKLQIALFEGQLATSRAQQEELTILSRSDAERASVGLDTLRARASDADARAPIAGVVLARYAELGEVVAVNQDVFRIGDTDRLQVQVFIDEADIARVRVGMAAAVRVPAYEERAIRARVSRIGSEAVREQRSFRVDLELVEAVEGLLPGMSAECNVILEQHEGALLVPIDAAHGDYAWVVGEDGVVQRRAIVRGIRDIGRIEVAHGVGAGELLIVSDESGLTDGEIVSPSLAERTAGEP